MRSDFWRNLLALALLCMALHASAQWKDAPKPQPLASDVWWLPGSFLPKRQPDGNTMVFQGSGGLVVFDTGRHPWHGEAILEFARSRALPVVAIVNSHWHLDHVSGNPMLKAAHPGVTVFASDAIDEALTGFLKSSMASSAQYLQTPGLPPETAEDLRLDMATIANGAALKPDVVVRASGEHTLAGRIFQMHLATHGPTAGDVWLYDLQTRIAAVGDLVTLPAPFLDTACVAGWLAALEKLAELPFVTLVPGHGPPMKRPEFDTFHAAFKAFVACARSDQDAKLRAGQWRQAVDGLLAMGGLDARQGEGMAHYYVAEVLRPHGGNSKTCKAPL